MILNQKKWNHSTIQLCFPSVNNHRLSSSVVLRLFPGETIPRFFLPIVMELNLNGKSGTSYDLLTLAMATIIINVDGKYVKTANVYSM